MSRERLIAEVTSAMTPGPWRDLLGRALEGSGTWESWLVLWDDGNELGYLWAADNVEALLTLSMLRGRVAEARAVPLRSALHHEVFRMAHDECAGVDWDDLLA